MNLGEAGTETWRGCIPSWRRSSGSVAAAGGKLSQLLVEGLSEGLCVCYVLRCGGSEIRGGDEVRYIEEGRAAVLTLI